MSDFFDYLEPVSFLDVTFSSEQTVYLTALAQVLGITRSTLLVVCGRLFLTGEPANEGTIRAELVRMEQEHMQDEKDSQELEKGRHHD